MDTASAVVLGKDAPTEEQETDIEEEALAVVAQSDEQIIMSDRSFRARISEIALLRAQGMNNRQIAEKLGLKRDTIKSYVNRARGIGLLRYDNPEARLQYELAPLIVDNVRDLLLSDNENIKLKATVEAAKGIGLYKSHQAVKVEGATQQMALAIRFEMPDGGPNQTTIEGVIVGAPKLPTPAE